MRQDTPKHFFPTCEDAQLGRSLSIPRLSIVHKYLTLRLRSLHVFVRYGFWWIPIPFVIHLNLRPLATKKNAFLLLFKFGGHF